jgi:hypothetical protein
MTTDQNTNIDEMGIQLLKKALFHFDISSENAELIISKFKPLLLRKGMCFSEKDRTSTKLGILIKGFLYSTYEAKNGSEIVSRFFYRSTEPNLNDNFIVSSFKSFSMKIKSEESIIALEESYLLSITYSSLKELYEVVPQMNYVGRMLAELSYIKALERVHLLQIQKHEDRVRTYYEQQPVILMKAQIKHLASYLATNRNTISRARKKVLG